jgi:hypothetical protein
LFLQVVKFSWPWRGSMREEGVEVGKVAESLMMQVMSPNLLQR